jgi:adenylyltransferase/sulfurtransferase
MDGQKRLKNAKVLAVGAGGLGSPVLMYLAAAGVGTLGIVEFDVVDESNLQRQIIHGSPTSAGPRPRARGLHQEINPLRRRPPARDAAGQRQRDGDLQPVRPHRRRHRQLRHALPGQRRVRAARQALRVGLDLPLRRPGLGLLERARPNYRDLYPVPPPPGMVPSCAEGGVLGVLCATIGAIQATEAVKLITGIGETLLGRLMVYDALEMTFRTIKVRKDPRPSRSPGSSTTRPSAASSPTRPSRPPPARRSPSTSSRT